MSHPADASVTPHRFRIALSGDGQPGQIEERIGRRLVRLIDPRSDEGRMLISTVAVEWVGPDGVNLGRIGASAAYAELLRRLETRLSSAKKDSDRRNLEECLDRIRGWSETLAGRI